MKPKSNIQKELLCLSSYFLNNSNYNTENQYINEQMFFYGRLNLNPLLLLFYYTFLAIRHRCEIVTFLLQKRTFFRRLLRSLNSHARLLAQFWKQNVWIHF